MAVSATTSTTATSGSMIQPEGAVGKKELQKDDFMKLFITQLQYQDPMKPMDNYQMASQLAQFSNMEATTKMSANMEKLLNYQTSQNNLQLLSLLDKNVQVTGNNMGVVDGQVKPTEFVLDDPPTSVQVTIYDAEDNPVWQKDIGPQGAGAYKVEWDGKSASGQAVADGAYHYEVEALSSSGELLPVDYRSTGRVSEINYDQGTVKLTIDGMVQANSADVIKVLN